MATLQYVISSKTTFIVVMAWILTTSLTSVWRPMMANRLNQYRIMITMSVREGLRMTGFRTKMDRVKAQDVGFCELKAMKHCPNLSEIGSQGTTEPTNRTFTWQVCCSC